MRNNCLNTITRTTVLVAITIIITITFISCQTSQTKNTDRKQTMEGSITGSVKDDKGPVAWAVVRVQATDNYTLTDSKGRFEISSLIPGESFRLTAWAPGYYNCGGDKDYGIDSQNVEIHLIAHADEDNPNYQWLPSESLSGEGESQGCAECHSNAGTEFNFPLPVDEWKLDAHSRSAKNPFFLTMYSGTDILGNKSPPTVNINRRDYGRIPLPPNLDKPYFGPGFKLDFPEIDGSCAACHTPTAAVNNPYSTDPRRVTGVGAEGVSCDFCHKVWDVRLKPGENIPYPNMPGVLSFEFRRPYRDHQFFAGPFDDVAPFEDTYSPLQKKSRFCAPCHFGVFWDTIIYNSYGEWLDSPYSSPVDGQSCQDCHMPKGKSSFFALPEKGGLDRVPNTIGSHKMPGVNDTELLQNSVTMVVTADWEDEKVTVTVAITNDMAGHHVPTDSPLRHMLLLLRAAGEGGEELQLLEGPTVPEWGGRGDPDSGYYAGRPGKGYAKILQERWTGISPSGAYWNPTDIILDNRIAAFETDISQYSFFTGRYTTLTINAKLIFRRAFIELRDLKKWETKDILMEEQNFIIRKK